MRKRIVASIAGLATGLGIPFAIGPSALAASAPSLGLQLSVDASGSTVAYQAVTSASGSASHPVFQFWTNSGHGWHVAQHYSTNRQFEISSAQAQNTLVLVFALTQAEWKARDYQAAVYAMQVLNMGQVSMTLPYSPVVGTSYTLTASPYQIQDPVYQLWVQSPTGQWTSTNYQSSPTFSWKPTSNGNYQFVIFARDGNLPAYPSDEAFQDSSVSTAGTPVSLLFQSALPFVPSGGTKTVTATVLNAADNADTAYSGPVTVSVNAAGAFSVEGASGPVSNGSVTVDAQHGEAAFTLTGGSNIGASGSLTVTQPFKMSSPLSLAVVANSTTDQVGYGLFTASGTRISSTNPLSVPGPVNPYQQPNIPVTLKPVNVDGTPIAATFTDEAQLAPYQRKISPSYPASSYSGTGLTYTGQFPFSGSEYALVKKGTTSMSLEFSPGTGGLYVLEAIPQKLVAKEAVITGLTSSSGTVLTPVSGSSGNATVTGVQPNTAYQVTAQLVDQYGEPIAEGAYSGTPSVTISSSAARSTPAMVSVPTASAAGQWTFTYVTGSSANAFDMLSLGTGSTLTTNPY